MDAITALKDRPQTRAGEKSRAKGAFSRLLSPIRIGNIQLKNRIALSFPRVTAPRPEEATP